MTPPSRKQTADDWLGLETVRRLEIKFESVERYESFVTSEIIGHRSCRQMLAFFFLISCSTEWVFVSLSFPLSLFFFFVWQRPACDVAISGLGWISVEPKSKLLSRSDSDSEETAGGELHLAVHVPKPVEIFVRPPMPVGKSGAGWYQYRELTDKEDEDRPKWYF